MIAKTLDDLRVYKKASLGSVAVSALLPRIRLCKDYKLCELYYARGSANEVRSISRAHAEVGRMLTRLIQYLRRSDRRDRG